MKIFFQFILICFIFSISFTNSYGTDSEDKRNEVHLNSKSHDKGLIIAAMGISGSGKSSVMRALSTLCQSDIYCEPEEKEWPPAVIDRELSGNFTMLTWFRSIRVPHLYKADVLRQQGKMVLLDSYYDKLFYSYIGKPGMEWIMDPTDPYYEIAHAIVKQDWYHLPNVDIIIFFDIDYQDWTSFLDERNRRLDCDEGFRKSFDTQKLFLDAVQKCSEEHNIEIVIHKQEKKSAKENAKNLYDYLIKNNEKFRKYVKL